MAEPQIPLTGGTPAPGAPPAISNQPPETTGAPAVAASSVAAPAAEPPVSPAAEPAAPAAPAEAKPAQAIDRPSLLETATKAADKPVEAAATDAAKPGEKPAETPKPVEAAKPEEKPAEPPKPAEAKPAEAAAPVEYKFEMPEVLKADEETMGVFTGLLGKVSAPVDVGQELLNLHAAAMQKGMEFVASEQHRVFNETRDKWNTEVMADPVIGGAGHLTAMGKIARMRDTFVPKEMMEGRKWPDGTPRLSEFEEFIRITGAGDHRVFNRIMYEVARKFDEPQADEQPVDRRPPAGNGRAPKGNLYTHPSSANMKTS